MNYNNFVLVFNSYQPGNFWFKNYNFIEVDENFIMSRYKSLDIIVNGVLEDNKDEKIQQTLQNIFKYQTNKPKKLLYKEDETYGFWDFENYKFVAFSNQSGAKQIITHFLVDSFII